MKDYSPNNKKKIAFCITSFRAGGGEKQMIEIANAFSARGYNIDLIVLQTFGPFQGLLDKRIHVVYCNARRLSFSLPKIVWYFINKKPDIVLATDQYTHLLILLVKFISCSRARICLRVGSVFTELMATFYGKNKLTPYLMRYFYRYADIFIANSQGVADDLRKIVTNAGDRTFVIFNPKDIEEIRGKADELSEDRAKDIQVPVIITMGRLRERKNFSLLIKAFAQLYKKIPAQLLIIGEGGERKVLQQLIDSLRLGDVVTLLGHHNNPFPYLKRADIFVFPSSLEGLPNAIIEAMICGAPIVSSDCNAGPREILAPDTDYRKRLMKGGGVEYAKYGVLFAVDDKDALIEAMTTMLGDASLRAKYSALSKERAETFDSEHIVTEYARALGLHN